MKTGIERDVRTTATTFVDGSAKGQIRSAACPFFFPFVLGFGAPEPEHEEKDLGSGLWGGSTRVCRWGRTTCFF